VIGPFPTTAAMRGVRAWTRPAERWPRRHLKHPSDIERKPALLYITTVWCYTSSHPQSL